MVVVPVTRLDTQIVTRPDPGSRSRTIANAAVADCSSAALSSCESTSLSGSIGNVIVLNGAAASSPVIRASALRVTSSSVGDTSTTTRPRQEGVASTVGAVAGEFASAIAVRSAMPIIGRREGYVNARRIGCAMPDHPRRRCPRIVPPAPASPPLPAVLPPPPPPL